MVNGFQKTMGFLLQIDGFIRFMTWAWTGRDRKQGDQFLHHCPSLGKKPQTEVISRRQKGFLVEVDGGFDTPRGLMNGGVWKVKERGVA